MEGSPAHKITWLTYTVRTLVRRLVDPPTPPSPLIGSFWVPWHYSCSLLVNHLLQITVSDGQEEGECFLVWLEYLLITTSRMQSIWYTLQFSQDLYRNEVLSTMKSYSSHAWHVQTIRNWNSSRQYLEKIWNSGTQLDTLLVLRRLRYDMHRVTSFTSFLFIFHSKTRLWNSNLRIVLSNLIWPCSTSNYSEEKAQSEFMSI